MNASEHDECSALFRQTTHGVPPQRIPCVNAEAYNIPRVDGAGVKGFYCLVTQNRITELDRSGSRQDEEPSRRNYCRAKRSITGIDYMDSQTIASARVAADNANTSRGLIR
jgi:hypothetical protein